MMGVKGSGFRLQGLGLIRVLPHLRSFSVCLSRARVLRCPASHVGEKGPMFTLSRGDGDKEPKT